LVRHELNASKVKVVTNFSGQLPACALDSNKIRQVFVNLFTNACHAMADGGVLTISTSLKRVPEDEAPGAGKRFRAGDEVVLVEIADTGMGIPPDKLSRVFDPYFTTKPPGKGTGLGLTVTKTIIDMHGGRLLLHNADDGGTVATVILKTRGENEKS
jgi:signal transduction histidine kinase